MKITANTHHYSREVDPAVTSKNQPSEKVAETGLDALNRPIEERPVEAMGQPSTLRQARARPGAATQKVDQVALSEEAHEVIKAQEEVRAKLTEEIAIALEATPVDLSDHRGMDYTPDAISQRVVDFAVSLHGVFRDKHPALTDPQAKLGFENKLRGAAEHGFAKALAALEERGAGGKALSQVHATKSELDTKLNEHFAATR